MTTLDVRPQVRERGTEARAAFKLGETTEESLIGIVGTPDSRTEIPGPKGICVLRYDFAKVAVGLPQWIESETKRALATIFFVVVGGIVTRYWSESASPQGRASPVAGLQPAHLHPE